MPTPAGLLVKRTVYGRAVRFERAADWLAENRRELLPPWIIELLESGALVVYSDHLWLTASETEQVISVPLGGYLGRESNESGEPEGRWFGMPYDDFHEIYWLVSS